MSSEQTREVGAAAVRVLFFEDRAEVTRAGGAELTKGPRVVALTGGSPVLDDRSVQARVVEGSAKVTAVRVRRRSVHEDELAKDPARVAELEGAERQDRALEREADDARIRANARLARAEVALRAWTDGLAEVPKGLGESDASVEQWKRAFEGLAREADAALTESLEAAKRQRDAEQRRKRAAARMVASKRERPRWESLVEVVLEVESDGPVRVEVTYRVPCALWRPEHLARLSTEGDGSVSAATKGKARVTTYATVWQRTGERWDDVEAVFSTARPARDANAPLLKEDLLRQRRKSDYERKHVVVDVREQAVATAGVERGARAVEEMPGVDDGGEARTFRAKERVRVPSDGRPMRVEVHSVEVPVTVERVAYPERTSVTHLRATGTLGGGTPLLAGPVRLARGPSVVGKATLSYVGLGEPFELGFGADDGVRVRRESSEQRDTVPVVGTQKIERKVRVYLSNTSGESRRVLVHERVPVSELEDVTVALGEAPGWKHDARDGFLRADVELGPRATKELLFTYELRAGSKVVLPT